MTLMNIMSLSAAPPPPKLVMIRRSRMAVLSCRKLGLKQELGKGRRRRRAGAWVEQELCAGAPGWLFHPGLARPGSKSTSPCGLQPRMLQTPPPPIPQLGPAHLADTPARLAQALRVLHGPASLCPHLVLRCQPGPPSEVLLDDGRDQAQVWDWKPCKGEKLRMGHPVCPRLGKTSGILEF